MVEDTKPAFVLRLNSEESERRLFVRRWLYVGVRRGWTSGSKILLLSKFDTILGFGVVARIQTLEELQENERALCLQKNWSAKLHFAGLARFNPPLPISATPLASQNPITLHGSDLAQSAAEEIEDLAIIKIIT